MGRRLFLYQYSVDARDFVRSKYGKGEYSNSHTSAKATFSHLPKSGQGFPGSGAKTSLAKAAPETPMRTRSSISGGRFLSAFARAADATFR